MATKRLWRWRGIDAHGAPCQGMLWQASRLEVLHDLQQQRVMPLAVRRCAVKLNLWHPRYSSETIRQLATPPCCRPACRWRTVYLCWRSSNHTRNGKRCLSPWAASWLRA